MFERNLRKTRGISRGISVPNYHHVIQRRITTLEIAHVYCVSGLSVPEIRDQLDPKQMKYLKSTRSTWL